MSIPNLIDVSVRELKASLRARGIGIPSHLKKKIDLYNLLYHTKHNRAPLPKSSDYSKKSLKKELEARGVKLDENKKSTKAELFAIFLQFKEEEAKKLPLKLILESDLKDFCSLHKASDIGNLNLVLEARGYRIAISSDPPVLFPPLTLSKAEILNDYTLSDLKNFLIQFEGECKGDIGDEKKELSRDELVKRIVLYYSNRFVDRIVPGGTVIPTEIEIREGDTKVYWGNRRFYRTYTLAFLKSEKAKGIFTPEQLSTFLG